MDKKVVALLFGGKSNEHEVSKMSAMTILSALSEEKYFVLPIYITKSGKWFLYDGPKENIGNNNWEKFATPVILSPDSAHRGILRLVGDKYKVMPIDVVFPIIHGQNGEDGSIQGLCQLSGIPYVGCGILSSALCMDKVFTKIIAKSIGLPQMEYITCKRSDLEIPEKLEQICRNIRYKLGYPCFIKPANTGSSVGIMRAMKKSQLIEALRNAALYDEKIVIEKAAIGREFECAVLGNEEPIASRIGEIRYETDFYDYDAKYNDTTSQTIVDVADIPEEFSEKIREYALKIYKACDCRGMARVDFFFDEKSNKIIFNEINTVPGFTSISMYAMLWKEEGIAIDELCDRLIKFALENGE
ncbi:MAG: D-alanine--D-alanine ligase [Defluviitaleaceae bacterium]|nr:D-alanine--D-alanine ligase [Defluviitaleaceae bacterium]